MIWQPAEDDEDMRCPYCGAYHVNEFAAAYHLKICQLRNSKTEPEEE